MKTEKRPESVLVVIYSHDGQVLMLERCQPEGFWQSVTGSLEWGEAPAQTAVRELEEETGLDGTGLRDMQHQECFPILPAWRHRYGEGVEENMEHWFALKLKEVSAIRLSKSEHTRYQWLSWTEAAERASSWTNRDAILKLFEE